MNFLFKCPLCKMQKYCADEDVGKTYICSWCNKNVIITAPGTFSVVCPKCKSVLTTDTEIAGGTKIQCGSCEHKFVFVDKKKDFSNALKQHQKKKQQESDDLTKGCLIILCSIVGLFLVFWAIWEYTGRFCRPPASSSNSDVNTLNSYTPKKITKEMVIAQTKIALDLAAQHSGSSYSRFTVDHCIIGHEKAVCHFSLYEKGVKRTGGVEFNITPRGLVPSGQFYLE